MLVLLDSYFVENYPTVTFLKKEMPTELYFRNTKVSYIASFDN